MFQFVNQMSGNVASTLGLGKQKEESNSGEYPPTPEQIADLQQKQFDEELEKHKKLEREARKNEASLIILLEKARDVYVEKQLVGSIDVNWAFSVFCRSVSCKVHKEEMEPEFVLSESGRESFEVRPEKSSNEASISEDGLYLAAMHHLATVGVGQCIGNLKSRAVAYKRKKYRADIMLTHSYSVADPFMGLARFSISCSANAESLLDLLERKETRAAASVLREKIQEIKVVNKMKANVAAKQNTNSVVSTNNSSTNNTGMAIKPEY